MADAAISRYLKFFPVISSTRVHASSTKSIVYLRSSTNHFFSLALGRFYSSFARARKKGTGGKKQETKIGADGRAKCFINSVRTRPFSLAPSSAPFLSPSTHVFRPFLRNSFALETRVEIPTRSRFCTLFPAALRTVRTNTIAIFPARPQTEKFGSQGSIKKKFVGVASYNLR